MNTQPYIEQDCTFEHEGTAFTAGGAFITDRRIIAYPGKNGVANKLAPATRLEHGKQFQLGERLAATFPAQCRKSRQQ